MAVDLKSSQAFSVHAGVLQGSILGPTCFLLCINDLPHVICNIAIYTDDTTLYSKCNQTSDLWQQLKLVSELESDLGDTVDKRRKWLVDFSDRKIKPLFDWSNNSGATDVKTDGSLLEEKSSFKDSHRKNTPSNKTVALTKNTNMYIWAIDTLNQQSIRGSFAQVKFSKEKWSNQWQKSIVCDRFIL